MPEAHPLARAAALAESPLPLRLDGIGHRAGGRTLLSGITLTLGPGGPTFILGPNGAGKTLLLRVCHGLLAPTEGAVRWGGAWSANGDAPAAQQARDQARRRQAMVFQRPILLRRSAAGNIEHALRIRGVPAREAPARAALALERVGLVALARRPARVLSGGEQQRVAIARAWALEPDLLLLDEPTANLDPSATQAIEAAMAALHAAGVTLLVTSHDLAQARRLAGRIVFLHRGRVLEDASARQFFAGPTAPEARAFLRGELLP